MQQEYEIRSTFERHRILNYRNFMGVAAGLYLLWWFIVEAMSDGAYNPFWSRLLAVAIPGLSYFFCLRSPRVLLRAEPLFYLSVASISVQNLFLTYVNFPDLAWGSGAYITAIALSVGFQRRVPLAVFSLCWVVGAFWIGGYYKGFFPFFAPGMVSVLLLINIISHYRFKMADRIVDLAVESHHGRVKLAEAQGAVRTRDDFISVASHELKTPLTSLKLNLHLLARQGLEPSVLRKVDAAQSQVDRLVKLVEDMLDVSRIHEGKLQLEIEEFDLRQAINECISSFSAQLAQTRTPISIVGADQVWVRGDRARLEQVFANLIKNAILYGPGKEISVSIRVEGARALVSVKDQGIGIELRDQARVFGRFERAVPSRNYGGMGLGLYISRKIVEAHGGSIELSSQAGVGTQLLVELPLRAEEGFVSFQSARSEATMET